CFISDGVPCSHHVFFVMLGRPPGTTLFPYTTLFRSAVEMQVQEFGRTDAPLRQHLQLRRRAEIMRVRHNPGFPGQSLFGLSCSADRKSTRLNSSHVKISYAVFCLKKKRSTHRSDCKN